jgi:hypothetical protein
MWRRKSSKTRRRTEIRLERREISLLFPADSQGDPCTACGNGTVRAEDVASGLRVEIAEVLGWLREGRVHGQSNASGQLLICADSLRSAKAGGG